MAEDLETPDTVAMETTQQESPSDRFDRLSPEPKPDKGIESAAARFDRLSPEPPGRTTPQAVQASADQAFQTTPDKAARILNAIAAKRKIGEPVSEDYVASNLDQVENENQRQAFLDKVANDFSDMGPGAPQGKPFNPDSLDKILADDPLKARLFSNPDDLGHLQEVVKSLRTMMNPSQAPRPFTHREKQEQAERWADQRMNEWLNSPMTWLGTGTHNIEEERSDLVLQALDKINQQEEYIAGTDQTGFFSTFKKIHQDNPFWWSAWFHMVDPIEHTINVNMAKARIDAKKGSLADLEFIERENRYAQARVRRGEDFGGYFAELASSLPAYIGGLRATQGIAQGVEKMALEKGAGLMANQLANPVVLGGVTSAAKLAGIGTQTFFAGAPGIVNEALNNQEDPAATAFAKATINGLLNYGSAHISVNPLSKLIQQETGSIPDVEALVKRMAQDIGKKTFAGTVEGALGFVGVNEATKLAQAALGTGEYHLPAPKDAAAQLVLGGLMGFAGSHLEARNDLRNAETIRDEINKATDAINAIGANKTAPDAVDDTVKQLAADHGVPMTRVDPNVFQAYYQEKAKDQGAYAHQFADELTGKKGALADAILDNQDLQIPTETFIRKINSDAKDRTFFQDKTTIKPLAPSVEEAKAHLDSLNSEIEEFNKARTAKKELAAQPSQNVPTFLESLTTQLRENLKAAGFDKEAVASTALVASGFKRLKEYAEQSGIDPEEFLKRYFPQIETEQPGPQVPGSQYVRVLDQSGKSHIEQVRGSSPREVLESATSQWPDATIEPMTPEEVQHYLPIAMDRPDSTVTLEQPEQPAFDKKTPEGARGRINIGPASVSINLLKTADSSTFVHELGHLYLEALGDLATRETDRSSLTVKKDFQTVMDWLGVKDRSEIDTEHHEKFARGFERYLMEGEAPSASLRQVFHKFRDWLVGIYRDVSALNVDLSPEVKDVFDRLLASDAEISRARERAGGTDDMLDVPGISLSAKDRATRAKLEGERDEAATAQVDARALADLKKQQTKQYQHAREMMEQQVTEEVNRRPEQIALSLLQRGEMPDGEKLPEGLDFKLDRNAIPKLFGEQYSGIDLKALPRGITVKEGGIHPDIAAELLGFNSGRELIQKLQGLDYKETIQRETEARMEREVEKPLETLDEAARKAIRNDKEAELKIFGMRWLAENKLKEHTDLVRAITNPVRYLKQVRDYVTEKIAEIPADQLDPSNYEAGEKDARKKARDAALQGLYGEAFKWKDKELLNHEFFLAATEAKEAMQDGIPKMTDRFFDSDAKLAKSRDMNFVSAGRAVAAAFGLGQSDKLPEAYLKNIKSYAPETYAAIKDLIDNTLQGAVPFDKMSYGQFQDLKTTLDALWQQAKDGKELVLAEKTVAKEQAIGELTPRIQELGQEYKGLGMKEEVSKGRKVQMMLLGARAAIRRVESWAEMVGQVAKNYITDPIFQATANYREARKENLKGYMQDVQGLDAESFKPRRIEAPELGYTFSGKGEILSAILHTGNDSNQGKLLVGRGWGTRDAEGNLDTSKWDAFRDRMIQEGVITKADYDFAQKVWDRFDALKKPAWQAHYDMYGFYPGEVTKRPVATPWGEYEGGYVPAKVDPWISRPQALKEERESIEKNDNSFMYPTTGRGMTKYRAESFAAPLMLSLDILPGQFDKVLRFTHIEPTIKNVAKIVFDKDFRQTLDNYDPGVAEDMLVPWLQRTAQQQVTQPATTKAGKMVDAVCRWLRTTTGMQMMVANVENSLEQTTGLFNSKLQTDGLLNALWEYRKDPQGMSDLITEKSVYMRNRSGVQEMEIQKRIDDMVTFPSQWKKLADFTDTHGYFMQEGIQNIVDKITWHAAYNEAIEGGKMTDAEAVLHADSVVRQTQFSSNPEDIARIEAGGPFQRMFTMFMSHWNRQLNLLMTEHAKAGELDGAKAQNLRKAFVWFTGFVMPAIVAQGISNLVSGRKDDEKNGEPENPMLGMTRFFFGALRSNAVSMVPVVGPLADSVISHFMGEKGGDKFGSSPAIESTKHAISAPVSVAKAATGTGRPGEAVRDVLTAVGMATKTPLGALGRPLGYLTDVAHGDTRPENPVDLFRGLVSGHGKKVKR